MDELFKKRMEVLLNGESVGQMFVEKTNMIQNKTFCNDQNFRQGMLYDWEMNEIEMTDFKFEKKKEFAAEGYEIEYFIHFRPNVNPEYLYKDRYFKNDGRERLGFFIDVKDMSKKINEKWLIVGKDDRVAFDRYNAMKCNWMLEWVNNGKHYSTMAVIRSASLKSSKQSTSDSNLGGTTISGDMTAFIPSSLNVSSIKLGTRFMISDSPEEPQCFEVINKVDTAPLGVTKLYLRQCMYNPNRDICGVINDMTNVSFNFELPILDLPIEFGGSYHMICNCVESKGLNQEVSTEVKLSEVDRYLYVNGESVVIKALCSDDNFSADWHIFVDGTEYTLEDLNGYFDIKIDKKQLTIRSTNKIMAKYIIKVAVYDDAQSYYDFVEMEVRI